MVIILRGVSGSGKSTLTELLGSTGFKFKVGGVDTEPSMTPAISYIKQLWNSFIKRPHKYRKISADDFFTVSGEYKFDAKLLDTAHATCLREFVDAIKDPESVIVLDNTNCTLNEVVTYAQLAKAFAHELQVVTLLVAPDIAWSRNKHGTPYGKVVQQSLKLQESIHNWPSRFPQQIFPA